IFASSLRKFSNANSFEVVSIALRVEACGPERMQASQINPSCVNEQGQKYEDTPANEARVGSATIHQAEGKDQARDDNGYEGQQRGAFGVENGHIVDHAVADRIQAGAGFDADSMEHSLLFGRDMELGPGDHRSASSKVDCFLR